MSRFLALLFLSPLLVIAQPGTLDASFDPGTGLLLGTNVPTAYALDFQGTDIVVGGSFDAYNGVARKGIVRVNSDGSIDTAFDPQAGAAPIYALAVQTDGKIVIGGAFTNAA